MKNFQIMPKQAVNLEDLEFPQKMFLLEAESLLGDMERIKTRTSMFLRIQEEKKKDPRTYMPESVKKALQLEGFSTEYLAKECERIKESKIKELTEEMEKL